MKLWALLLLFLAGCSQPTHGSATIELSQSRFVSYASTVYERVHGATFQMQIGHYLCSATAIGPHTLLTTGHCFDQEPTRIFLNGGYCDIGSFQTDGHDHALLGTDAACQFHHWVPIGKIPKQGDSVFLYGNPMDLSDQLRFGRMSGWGYVPDQYKTEQPGFDGQFELFDLNSAPGDSGSGIFNAQGELVAVLSIGTIVFTDPLQLAGALPLGFTAEQFKAAGVQS